MWQKSSSTNPMTYTEAVKYVQPLNIAGYTDWRLPNAIELQSLLKYNKTTAPAINTDFFTILPSNCNLWSSTSYNYNIQQVIVANKEQCSMVPIDKIQTTTTAHYALLVVDISNIFFN